MMPAFTQDDQNWMLEALRLAALGQGYVEPNPMVGCVLVRNSLQIGAGYHRKFGGPHAELAAITDAGATDLQGATAYVTLEPCCHFGKTPPCTDALIAAKVGRVIAATTDPNSLVAGKGLAKLREAGIAVDVGLFDEESRELNAPYFKRLQTGKPWVIAKWAMSMDGKIATRTGHSQWISGEPSRKWVHELRGRVDAVIVGIGTALADNPMLTARPPGPRQALRVVIDSQLRLPAQSHLVQSARSEPLLICTGPDADTQHIAEFEALGCEVWQSRIKDRNERLMALLELLCKQYNATNVLVEGGSELLGSLFDLQQIDQCEVFIAPKLIGGQQSPSPLAGLGVDQIGHGPVTKLAQVQTRDQDFHLSYRLRW